MTRRFLWLLGVTALLPAETFTYWIEPCSAEVSRQTTCAAKDPELAEWAIEAWQKAADLTFATAAENHARIRIYWASDHMRLYGKASPILVDGKRGSAIHVNPDVSQLGEEIYRAAEHDTLLRDAIIYLTCLHESGHALGLSHTGKFEDIMYSFGFGGDIVEYFERYRRRIGTRQDIRTQSAISAYDRQRLLQLLRQHP
ncbi:MAG: matrixin family metalloprotease [Acidobacteriia bacterium]|nr:matrixin family metalloprotease [Terriglobia bacterium]